MAKIPEVVEEGTIEQRKKEAAMTTRLLNLETEVINAGKNLTAINNDTARLTKENEYQAQILADTKQQVTEAQKVLADTKDSTKALQESNTAAIADMAKKTSTLEEKDKSLANREIAVEKKEKENTAKESKLEIFSQKLTADAESFNSKVAKLKEVTSIF